MEFDPLALPEWTAPLALRVVEENRPAEPPLAPANLRPPPEVVLPLPLVYDPWAPSVDPLIPEKLEEQPLADPELLDPHPMWAAAADPAVANPVVATARNVIAEV